MTDDRAMFEATIHGLRTVPTRKMVQIIVEAPIEHLSHIARVAEHGAWVCVARLNPEAKEETTENSFAEQPRQSPPAGGARKWDEMLPSQQAGILCSKPAFWKFLNEDQPGRNIQTPEQAAEFVRRYCKVKTRADIVEGDRSNDFFQDIVNRYHDWHYAARNVL